MCMAPLQERLGISQVIRYIFEFISSGAFYPNGALLIDTCRKPELNLLTNFEVEFIKNITSSAQDIVRMLVFDENGWEKLFPNLPDTPENFVPIKEESIIKNNIGGDEENLNSNVDQIQNEINDNIEDNI